MKPGDLVRRNTIIPQRGIIVEPSPANQSMRPIGSVAAEAEQTMSSEDSQRWVVLWNDGSISTHYAIDLIVEEESEER